MEAVCAARGDAAAACAAHALAAALHALHLYCASVCAALLCCCARKRPHWYDNSWRAQNVRGVVSIALGVTWCLGAAAATLRPAETVRLVAALMAPLAWLAAAALHVSFWTRRSSAPILYLAIYWLLSAATSAFILYQQPWSGILKNHVEVYIHAIATLLSLCVSAVDCMCFYDEVKKRLHNRQKSALEPDDIVYQHNRTHFYSKISFFWLNSLLYRGFETTLEENYLGELPEEEKSNKYYQKFKKIFDSQKVTVMTETDPSMWQCYVQIVWPNFYIAGIMKLFGDLIGVIPPLGLAVIIQFMENPKILVDSHRAVTIEEFLQNGYTMLIVVTLALVIQAFLSQNSTHLVTVEGTRLKTALQSMVYDKCMRLASWSSSETGDEEESPLLHRSEDAASTQSGLLTNLISQDTYNIMSCVWICHYVWAIPLKVTVILYLLYTKLGVSAIIGTIVSIFLITPLQFYIGKKLSDNSKHISKCTDHRVSKISEILQGINVIKLYVWEDLFMEKILQLREVELKLLNRDSAYWGFLTFTTQVSTVLVTVITFTLYYFLEDSKGLTAGNVFAGLALFNQLTIPLLILPVTVLMIIQAMVSTKRIKHFLDLPESSNVQEDRGDDSNCSEKLSANVTPLHSHTLSILDPVDGLEKNDLLYADTDETQISEDDDGSEQEFEYLVRFRNSAFSWKMNNNTWLDIGDIDIPIGKLIMVVGTTGSGKSSLLSAVLGEMYLERGDMKINGHCSMWYAGQPPWLLECSIRENVVMDSPWCPKRYARVLRATGLRPDLQLLPEGDRTRLGSHGTPLSGGQRVRVCVARALYSRARLLALDEPLGALDAALARHVVARGLLPAARARRALLLATNRLELLHYADLVIVIDDGRVAGFGKPNASADGALGEWTRLAAEARAAAARGGAGPPGGAARERQQLVRALSRIKFQWGKTDDPTVGISEAAGAHLLAEVPTCAGGSWRRPRRQRAPLARQLSSPPSSVHNYKWRREVRRAVSADESNAAARRLLRPRTHRTLSRWTPKTLRRLITSESDTPAEENHANGTGTVHDPTLDSTFTSVASNGVDSTTVSIPEKPAECKEDEPVLNECTIWWEYARACGWWGAAYWAAAACAQALALAADAWLASVGGADDARALPADEQTWERVRVYALYSAGGAAAAGGAQAACAAAGARARRALHARLLAAALHAQLHAHHAKPPGALLHRFSADVLVVDKKLPTAVSRWAQLALVCGAALAVNALVSPWSLLAILPALAVYVALQNVYLRNARELQRAEAGSAASVVALAGGARAGAVAVRAGRLQPRMRAALFRRLDRNHAALLLLNAANRWLGLALDLVGAGSVCVSLALSLRGAGGEDGAGGAGRAGLAGTYALLLPAYLAHLAKCRADLHLQLAAVERLLDDTRLPQEDYRDDCPIPAGWERKGKIEFQDVSIQPQPGTPPVLKNINFTVQPGEKVALCGRSGSGKSTLLLSCVGGSAVRGGRVLLDGADAARVPLRALRHRVVLLPQEPVMFSGTLRENLDPLAVHTDTEIWQSLRAVGLEDFVRAQPSGLECSVGRGGGGWSAGRAARACAARAALHAGRAAALLLDEPGAALDAAAERALLAALPAAAPGTTVLAVAHRISSLEGYDTAVVLEEGRVAERGELRALLAAPATRLTRLLPAAPYHK